MSSGEHVRLPELGLLSFPFMLRLSRRTNTCVRSRAGANETFTHTHTHRLLFSLSVGCPPQPTESLGSVDATCSGFTDPLGPFLMSSLTLLFSPATTFMSRLLADHESPAATVPVYNSFNRTSRSTQ